MITGIELTNVRSFRGAGWDFSLAPLTVFCGTNSAGKSTVLKALLLLQQCAESADGGAPGGLLRFSGRYVDFGSYEALVSDNDTSKPIKVSLSISDFVLEQHRAVLERFLPEDVFKKIQPAFTASIIRYDLHCDFTFVHSSVLDLQDTSAPSQKSASPLKKPSSAVLDTPGRGVLESAQYVMSMNDVPVLRWAVEFVLGAKKDAPPYRMLIPANYFRASGGENLVKAGNENDKGFIKFACSLSGLFPQNIIGERSDFYADSATRTARVGLPPLIASAIEDLRTNLRDIHYLGPLRSPGRRYYILAQDLSPDFDATGEFLPYILRDRINEEIRYCSPQKCREPKLGTLKSALNEWILFLKDESMATGSGVEEVASSFHKHVLGEVLLRGAGKKSFALADSGFGYSQVLPVLVRGLLCPLGATFIVEQPELHLHPALQVRLARFFVAMIFSGRMVALESHSEHLVNALRVLAAEDESGKLAHLLGVFFIETKESRPFVHDLSIRSDGTIPGWPPTFFGEASTLSGQMLRAQKRQRTQDKKDR